MQTLVRAYGKMSSAQKVTLENVNMMIDAGFNPLNQICDATGETMSDLYKRISDGKVSFSELEEAVRAATSEGGQFYNGMLEASQTFNGRLSTLQDNVSAFLGTLTDSLFETGSELLPWANETILTLTDALKKDGPQAMLTAAVEIVGSLAQYLGDHADEIVDAGVDLLVVDNGSGDDTAAVARELVDVLPELAERAESAPVPSSGQKGRPKARSGAPRKGRGRKGAAHGNVSSRGGGRG